MTSDQRTSLSAFSRRWKAHFRVRFRSLLCMLCVFLLSGILSGCGDSASRSPQTSGTAPSASSTKAEEGAIAPLIPPGANDRPPEPGTGTGLSTLPGMQPPKGLNVDTLFAQDIQDPMDRIKRVENVVLDLRRDFNTVLPSIMRLVAVEQDIQNLIGQLQTLTEADSAGAMASVPVVPVEPSGDEKGADPTGATQHLPAAQAGRAEDSQPPPAEESPPEKPPPDGEALRVETIPPEALSDPAPAEETPKPAPTSASVSPSGSSGGGAAMAHTSNGTVQGLRITAHPDKTRLVLVLSGAGDIHADVDNDEKILVIELPGSEWKTVPEGTADSPIVSSWKTEPMPDKQGTILIVSLKSAATLTQPLTIPQTGGGGVRIAIDLKTAP